MTQNKPELEPVNPKWLLRRICETLPPSLPEELGNMIIALYAHSNGWIGKKDAEQGKFEFSVTAPFSQLAKFCRMTEKGAKKRCERLRDDWAIVSWKISSNRNHGNDFSIRWEAAPSKEVERLNSRVPEGCTTDATPGGVSGRQGGVPERKGGVLEGSSGVPARTPSVLSGLSGSSGETIAIADVSSDKDEQRKTAGGTPATPALSPKAASGQEPACSDTASESVEPVSLRPGPAHDYVTPPSLATEPARWLANYLWCFLSVREDVKVLPGWERFWTQDFQGALDAGWSVEDVVHAIRASQVGRAREFYKRGASIVANLELLAEIGQQIESKDLLCVFECHKCHGLFIGVEALVEHQFGCYERPVDPEDAAEEEAMYVADEMVSEGYFKEHPEMATYYPWGDDDRHMFDPWADVPEQLPEPAGEQRPY